MPYDPVPFYSDRPIAKLSDLCFVIPADQENSVAQTRSFASLLVAVCSLGTFTSQGPKRFDYLESLPGVAERLIKRYADLYA